MEGDGAPQRGRSRGLDTPIYLATEGRRVVRCSQGAEEVCVMLVALVKLGTGFSLAALRLLRWVPVVP